MKQALYLSHLFSVAYQVSTKDGDTQVGRISKQWTGLVKELFTDADNFGVCFPMDLDVKVKATVLAATFLIVSSYCNNCMLVTKDNLRCIYTPCAKFAHFTKPEVV